MAVELQARGLHPGVVAAVLLLHVLLLGGLMRLGTWRDRGAPVREPAPVLLWLLRPDAQQPSPTPTREPPAPRPAGTPPARQPERKETAPATPAASPRPPAPVAEPQPITLPAAPAAPPAGPSATASPPPAEAAAPAPLNLALPRGASAPWRSRNPALDDPRSNTPRGTLEASLAAVLGGTDQIVEERLDDGRMRLRRGNVCVVVHPNRAERLDPWNASALPKMRGVEKC